MTIFVDSLLQKVNMAFICSSLEMIDTKTRKNHPYKFDAGNTTTTTTTIKIIEKEIYYEIASKSNEME